MHNSFLHKIAHMWNQWPAITRSSTTLIQFSSPLNGVKFAVYEQYFLQVKWLVVQMNIFYILILNYLSLINIVWYIVR